MNPSLTLRNRFRQGKEAICNSYNRWMMSIWVTGMVTCMSIDPTLCAPSMSSIFTKMLDIIYEIAFYVGAVVVVMGIFNWVLAMKDENADGQSRAIKFVVIGIALVALKTLLKPIVDSLTYT